MKNAFHVSNNISMGQKKKKHCRKRWVVYFQNILIAYLANGFVNKPSGSARITLYLMVKADNLFSDFTAIVLGNIRTILRLIGTGSLVQIQMIKNIMIPLTLKHGSEIQKYVNILILLTITRIFVITLTTGNNAGKLFK